MDKIVYKSNATFFLGIIESVLRENDIPFTVIGGADTGLAAVHEVQVKVPEKYYEVAIVLIEDVLKD